MSREIRIGLIGLGNRGTSLLEQVILPQNVCVAAVCDTYEDRREKAADIITDTGQGEPLKTDDYKKILEMPEIDAVMITAAWEAHIPIACEAMEAGKYAGFEVGGAYSLDECRLFFRTLRTAHGSREKNGSQDCKSWNRMF